MRAGSIAEEMKGKDSLVLGALLCVYAAWAMSPLMTRSTSSQVVIALVACCLAVGAMVARGSNSNDPRAWPTSLVFKVTLLFLMLSFAYWRVSDTVPLGNYLFTCLYFAPILFVVSLSRLGAMRTTWCVLVGAVAVSVVVALASISILRDDPYASKYLTGSVATAVDQYSSTNLATVPWVMSSVVLLPLILGMIALTGRTVLKVLLAGAFVLNLGLILLASSSTSTFVAIAFLAVTALRTLVDRPLLAIAQLVFIAIVLSTSSTQLAGSLSDDSAGLYEDRFSEVRGIFGNNEASADSDGSFATRLSETQRGIDSFFGNPLVGIGMVHGDPGKDPTLGVGMHSQVVDDIGRYGLLGLFLIFSIYFQVFSGIRERTRAAPRYYALSALACAGVLSIFNPTMFPSIGFVVLGMVPLYATLASERRSE